MKKFLNIGLTLLLSLGFSACFTEDQMGLPDKVYFSNEGGEQVLTANGGLGTIRIMTGDQDVQRTRIGDAEPFTIKQEYKWITVTHERLSNEFRVKVEANTTKKKRQITLEAYSGPDYATIKVEQAK